MKGRRGATLFLAAAGVGGLLLAGCGRGGAIRQIAFVRNIATEQQQSDAAIWSGVEQFGEEHEITALRITPASQDLADIERAIDSAVEEGADTIICFGQEMGQAIFDMQRMERATRFLFIDGVPEDGDSAEERIRGNTTCIAPAEEQAGFLAGYAAVSEGYRELMVLGAARDAAGARHVSGFVQGAEQAARDAGSNVEDVRVTVRYLGGNTASPALLDDIEEQFQNGCQFIYAFTSGPEFLAATAAERAGGAVILGGNSDDLPSEVILAIANIDYEMAARRICEKELAGELPDGETVTLYAEDGGAALQMEESHFRYFTQEQYDALIERISAGRIVVRAEDVTSGTIEDYSLSKVTVVTAE